MQLAPFTTNFVINLLFPQDVISTIMMSMIWLLRTTNILSGKVEVLGADSVFPIIVNVLVNAHIPNIHLVLVRI